METRINLLQAMPIFGAVDRSALAFLIDRVATVQQPSGAFFFREGDDADGVYVLEQGSVVVSKRLHDQESVIRALSVGDCFGEMALLDLYPRSASVMAVSPCQAIKLNRTTLLELYSYDLKQFTIIQMNMGREICRRLRYADEQLFQSGLGYRL